LAFHPREPRGLGKPDFIWVSLGPGGSWYRHLRLNYDTREFGVIVVDMSMDPISVNERIESWRTQVAMNGHPCVRGFSEIVTIKEETTALIGFPPEESHVNISWREDVVSVQVGGPTLQRADAIAIAEKL
jgi:hypothetical protein